jgi:hypothetical protein
MEAGGNQKGRGDVKSGLEETRGSGLWMLSLLQSGRGISQPPQTLS